MRRPLALFGFTFFIGSLLFLMVGYSVARWLLLPLGLASCLFFFFYRKQSANRLVQSLHGCVLAAFCCLILLTVTYAGNVQPLAVHHITVRELTVTVIRQDAQYDSATYYIVSAKGLYAHSQKTAYLRLSVQGPSSFQVGDVLQTAVRLQTVDPAEHTDWFSNRIYLTAQAESFSPPKAVGVHRGFSFYADKVRHDMVTLMNDNGSGEVAALMKGICLGETAQLSAKTVEDFSRTGTSHMVAVSGLHTGMVASLFVILFGWFRVCKRYVKLLSLAFVWFFVLVAQSPFSACRAGIMFTFVAIGSLLYQRSDTLNSLGGAILCVLLFDPFAAGDVGLLASVSACLGIILLADPIGRFIRSWLPAALRENRWVCAITNLTGVTMAAGLGTVPCSLLCFYTLSLTAPVANLPGVPLATVVLITGLLGSLLNAVPGLSLLSHLVLSVGGLCAKTLLWMVGGLSRLPHGSLPFVSVWCWLGFAVFCLGGVLVYRFGSRLGRWNKRMVALLLVLVLVCSGLLPTLGKNDLRLYVVGDAYDGSLVLVSRQTTVVIGCARPYAVRRQLSAMGIGQVDWLILPNDLSYSTDLVDLVSMVKVQNVVAHHSFSQRTMLQNFGQALPSVQYQTTVTAGKVTVTMLDDFTRFALQIHNVTVCYVYGAWSGTSSAHVTVKHPRLNAHRGFLIRTKELDLSAPCRTLIDCSSSVPKIQTPRRLFG